MRYLKTSYSAPCNTLQSACQSSPHCMCTFLCFRNPPKNVCPDGLTPVFFSSVLGTILQPSAVCPSGEDLGALLVAHLSCFFVAQLLCSCHELLAKCFCSTALGSQLGYLALWSNKEKVVFVQDRELQSLVWDGVLQGTECWTVLVQPWEGDLHHHRLGQDLHLCFSRGALQSTDLSLLSSTITEAKHFHRQDLRGRFIGSGRLSSHSQCLFCLQPQPRARP